MNIKSLDSPAMKEPGWPAVVDMLGGHSGRASGKSIMVSFGDNGKDDLQSCNLTLMLTSA